MKRDTSNQSIIDLDLHFRSKKPSKIATKIKDFSKPVVDLEDILLEWSYRLPKGYPTIVGGNFVEPKEVFILNEILKERGLSELELPEARVFHHPDWSYIPNDRNVSEFEAFGFGEEALKAQPFVHISQESSDWPEGATNAEFYLVKGSSKIRSVSYNDFESLVNEKNTVILRSDAYTDKYLIVQGDVNALTAAKGELSTDTEVKEGMVVLFYYAHPTIQTAPLQENVRTQIQTLKKVLDKVPSYSITDLTKRKLAKYLESVEKAKESQAAKALRDPYSSASLVLRTYNKSGWDMIRTGLFDRIRTLGSKLTGLVPDKWCPGDVYLLERSKISIIEKRLTQIEQEMPKDGVALLNGLFVNDWGDTEGSVMEGLVAISLKAERAQAGKAKQYLQLLSRKDLTYNVDKAEASLDIQNIAKRVEDYRKKIAALAAKATITVELDQDHNAASMDEKRLREKFASLKLVYYLLGDRGQDIDDNLLGAVAFGMSLSGVNPTFWKVIGNSSGTANVIENPAGSTIALLDGGLDSKKSKITIRDKDSNNAVRFEMMVEKQGHTHLVWLNARSNGLTQATLEIVKDKQL